MLNVLGSGYTEIKATYKAIKNGQLKDNRSVVNNASNKAFM